MQLQLRVSCKYVQSNILGQSGGLRCACLLHMGTGASQALGLCDSVYELRARERDGKRICNLAADAAGDAGVSACELSFLASAVTMFGTVLRNV